MLLQLYHTVVHKTAEDKKCINNDPYLKDHTSIYRND